MLKRNFNPSLVYQVVVYLRMSTDHQNPRSPEQQLEEIRRRLAALGFKWKIIKIYRDDGISGRYKRKRADYQRMLRDIKSGAIHVDLILVDTVERFGRVEDLQEIRKDLDEHYGVLVLTADSNFADPNTPQGRALGMVEAIRATEDGRIKAHNVLRGKRDAALLKHWPGGPPPFGYMLKSILKVVNGREEVDYCILVPNPETASIAQLVFQLAENYSWGGIRLSKALKSNPEIPAKFKEIPATTISSWLDNPIYYGELVWAANSTGIVDDMRVLEPNAEEDIVRVPEFCEGLVPRERWNKVHAVRAARSQRLITARSAKQLKTGKQLEAIAPGLALTYPLSGLVFCSCGVRMTSSSSSAYTAKDGETRRYVSYVCPRYLSGDCANSKHISEEWLRKTVVAQIAKRLFPRS